MAHRARRQPRKFKLDARAKQSIALWNRRARYLDEARVRQVVQLQINRINSAPKGESMPWEAVQDNGNIYFRLR